MGITYPPDHEKRPTEHRRCRRNQARLCVKRRATAACTDFPIHSKMNCIDADAQYRVDSHHSCQLYSLCDMARSSGIKNAQSRARCSIEEPAGSKPNSVKTSYRRASMKERVRRRRFQQSTCGSSASRQALAYRQLVYRCIDKILQAFVVLLVRESCQTSNSMPS